MPIDVLGLKTCDTCRAAVKALAAAGLEPRLRDIRVEPLSRAERAVLIDAFGEDLVNPRSATWRGLPETDRKLPPDELLSRHPAVMKRPVIRADGRMHQGWTPETRAALGL